MYKGVQMIPSLRDVDQTRTALQAWLRDHHRGGRSLVIVRVHEIELGYSAELFACDIAYEHNGEAFTEGIVVRIEPTPAYQLFLDTNFEEQYRVMEALARHTDTPIPPLLGLEQDLSVLGARFFVMGKAPGATGQLGLPWMNDVGREGRETMWWNGLYAMAELHRLDAAELGLLHLDHPERGADPLDQQLHYYEEYYDWARGGEAHPTIELAQRWLRENRPATAPTIGVSWGDARRGNQLFTDDLRCSAIIDFEQACLGPAEWDLAWWLEGEHQTGEALGIEVTSVEDTLDRYSEIIGRDLVDIGYYMVFASYRLAVLRTKLHQLREGMPDQAPANAGEPRLSQVLAHWAGVTAPSR